MVIASTTPPSRAQRQGPETALRIAMVTESYPPEVNGVANSVARVVEGLHARGHTLQLVRPRQQAGHRAQERDRFHEILTGGVAIPMYGHLRMGLPSKRALVRAWSRHPPSVVHIATEGPLGWSALRAALALGLPVCSDFRTNFHAYSRFYRLGWLHAPIMAYLRNFHRRCHCTMVPTDALRQQLAADGYRDLSVLARGVDTTLFSPGRRSVALRRQWGVGEDELVVLHVGRLAPEKNLGLLLQAYRHMQWEQRQVRLVVVGDGPSRATMQAHCPQAVFAGFRSGEDLAAHYASSDMFLFPSLTETFGNVVPEAMASGLPVVAFDDAAASQLITHETSGLLAHKGDNEAFLRHANALAAAPEQRLRLGGAARARALALGWEQVLERLEGIYTGAIRRAHDPMVWCGEESTARLGTVGPQGSAMR